MQLTMPNLRNYALTGATLMSFTLAACGGGNTTTSETVKEVATTTTSAAACLLLLKLRPTGKFFLIM